MRTFLDIDEASLHGAVVIIDVDGTLTYDKTGEVGGDVIAKIRRIALHADVYLASNGESGRTRQIAERAGVRYIETHHKKPSGRVLETVDASDARRVVIGDKVLTDGFLAAQTGAEFIPVARLVHTGDSGMARLIYLIDDIAASVSRMVFPILPYVLLMRPMQWVKNILVFAPAFFAADLAPSTLSAAAAAGLIFIVASSAVYIINDLKDVEQDRQHPLKRYRPIASFAVSQRGAFGLLGILAVLLFVALFYLPALVPIATMYIVGNVLYIFALKHIPMLDVVSVAFFYVLRVMAGGVAAGVFVSPWIILCAFFGALFLIVGKRRAEFSGASSKKVLASYTQTSLDTLLFVAAALVVLSYGLYSIFGADSPLAIFSTVFVFAAIVRLVHRMRQGIRDAEYPETLVFKDRWVFGLTVLWAAYMFVLLYSEVP